MNKYKNKYYQDFEFNLYKFADKMKIHRSKDTIKLRKEFIFMHEEEKA